MRFHYITFRKKPWKCLLERICQKCWQKYHHSFLNYELMICFITRRTHRLTHITGSSDGRADQNKEWKCLASGFKFRGRKNPCLTHLIDVITPALPHPQLFSTQQNKRERERE
eukprot:c11499_g1_i1 orf=2-337(-)